MTTGPSVVTIGVVFNPIEVGGRIVAIITGGIVTVVKLTIGGGSIITGGGVGKGGQHEQHGLTVDESGGFVVPVVPVVSVNVVFVNVVSVNDVSVNDVTVNDVSVSAIFSNLSVRREVSLPAG